jgi:hypothetical protein
MTIHNGISGRPVNIADLRYKMSELRASSDLVSHMNYLIGQYRPDVLLRAMDEALTLRITQEVKSEKESTSATDRVSHFNRGVLYTRTSGHIRKAANYLHWMYNRSTFGLWP